MNAESTNAASKNDGRDEAGRFTTGNKGGPGNPFARQVAALRQALLDTVPPERLQKMVAALVTKAEEGDVQAAKLILQYVIGKPQPAPDPDHLDIDEWNIFRETAPMKAEAAAMSEVGQPGFHINTVRALRPAITTAMQLQRRKELEEMMRETPAQRKAREDAKAAECERMLNSPAEQAEDFDPSTNGNFGAAPPSLNGNKRRPTPTGERLQPSTNGDLHPASATES